MDFNITKRIYRKGFACIHAQSENPVRKFTIFLDMDTGEPFYPLYVDREDLNLAVTLESDKSASIRLPLSIKADEAYRYTEELSIVQETVKTAREQIQKEQCLLRQKKNEENGG